MMQQTICIYRIQDVIYWGCMRRLGMWRYYQAKYSHAICMGNCATQSWVKLSRKMSILLFSFILFTLYYTSLISPRFLSSEISKGKHIKLMHYWRNSCAPVLSECSPLHHQLLFLYMKQNNWRLNAAALQCPCKSIV